MARVRRFLTLLFWLCTLSALYGCIQQRFGLFDFEMAWLMADEHTFGLVYIGGEFRKFSTMSDPAEFGIVMGAAALCFIILSMSLTNRLHKWIVYGGCVLMLLAMGYSGTRTANAMIVVGILLFIVLTINRRSSQLFALASVLLFLFLMYAPVHNGTVDRFRSTFYANQDASFNVREANRQMIQPYIHSHPIGGGLGTTGGRGMTYNAGHYLAGFQPDSGLLQKALELGWIGYILFISLYFTVLRTGIRGYFSSRITKNQTIFAACTCTLFCFYVADYAQVAFGQITDLMLYYPFIAILLKLKKIEDAETNGEQIPSRS